MILSKLQHRLQNQQQTKRLERCGLYEKYKKQAAKQLNGGFTLVELLVVIAIMAVMIGGSAIGISVITGGNVKKAGNYVYTQLNSLRSQTLTVNADWRLEIEKDTDDTYRIVIYKDNEETDSKVIGKGYTVTISDYKNSVDTPVTYSVDTGKKAAIAYTRSNGRIGLFTVNGGALASDKLDVANNLKAVITVSRGSRSYDVTVWYSTGKITLP
jgi:prepilin-type N-terminal cleavage/methylation domain-containing protein